MPNRPRPKHPEDRPDLTATAAELATRSLYGLDVRARQLPSYADQNFLLEGDRGAKWVLKVARQSASDGVLDLENRAMEHLARRLGPARVPELVPAADGDEIAMVETAPGKSFRVRLVTYLAGRPLAQIRSRDVLEDLGRLLARVDLALADFDHPAAHRRIEWDLRWAGDLACRSGVLPAPGERTLVEAALLRFEAPSAVLFAQLAKGVIHNDANDHNVLVDEGPGGQRVCGLIDFGDMVHTYVVCELAIAATYAAMGSDDPVAAARAVVEGYHAHRPLREPEVDALFPLLGARLATSVLLAAERGAREPDNEYVRISQEPAWALLRRLDEVSPREVANSFREACGFEPLPTRGRDPHELRTARRRHLGPSVSLSYREPLKIVRGAGQYLYDEEGRPYLDLVNNVCHVGHGHPRVVEAAARQMAMLNTNTRYLHDYLVEYAERLSGMLPEPLGVCYFVCSGSEANELALRLARAHTGRRDLLVLEGAYHGNTAALVEASPYKFRGAGGSGRPEPHVHVAPMPDGYRGRHRGAEAGAGYASEVVELLARAEAAGRPIGAFLAEPLLGCGGQIEPPAGYLAAAFDAVRAAGGVAIADEVQVGFGRVGSHFWAFESQGALPDVVTLGKPIGNGHPLGAVVTTPEIAASFDNGMEYFNTFGGNPVSCAVGLAVLEVIEREGLQRRASELGRRFRQRLERLRERHPLVGDVRGRGLFLGVELVRDCSTLEPAAEEAAAVVEGVKGEGVLLSTDGPFHNVLKVKPPMVLSERDVDRAVRSIDRALAAL